MTCTFATCKKCSHIWVDGDLHECPECGSTRVEIDHDGDGIESDVEDFEDENI